MNKQLKERIEKWSDKIYAQVGRCYKTAIVLAQRIGKDALDWYLVGNLGHYWLEDEEGNIIDAHYYIGDINDEIINPDNEEAYKNPTSKRKIRDILPLIKEQDFKQYAIKKDGKQRWEYEIRIEE